MNRSELGALIPPEYPIEAVLRSALRDAICYRSAEIPAGCCTRDHPCGEHVEAADCIAAYHWLAGHLGIEPQAGGTEHGPDDPAWRWTVEGTETQELATRTVEHFYADTDVIEAESGPDALLELIHRGPIWDGLNPDYPFTITISREA